MYAMILWVLFSFILKNNITSLFSSLGACDHRKVFFWGGMAQSHHIFSKKFEIAKFRL
jgi:hypothetical protein